MGNELKKIKKNKKNKEKITDKVHCPFCNSSFPGDDPTIFNNHIKVCNLAKIKIKKACDLYPPSQDYELNKLIFKNQKRYYQNLKK